jgi:pyruvate,water dikinase
MDGIKKQPAIWCNTNFREVMPMVQSTLNWSLKKPFLNAVFSAPFRAVGYQVPQGLQLVRKYQGRAYLSSSSLQWLFYDALGVGNGKSAYQEMADNLGEAQTLIEIKEKKHYLGMKGCKRLWRLLRLIVIGLNMKRNVTKYFSGVDRFTGQLLKDDFNTLTEIDLIKKFVEIRNTYTEFIPVFLFGPGEGIFPLVKALEKTFPGKGKAVANTLMAGKGDITSAQHGYLLVEMARIARGDDAARRFFSSGTFNPLQWEKELPEESPFRQSMRSFLAEYGHRGVYELDIINPRWREDPSYILHIIRSNMETADPGDIMVRQKEKANAAWRAISQRIPFYRRGLINNMLKQAIKSAERREAAKSLIVKIFESERLVFQAMGGRLAERGILIEPSDIYHCTWNEIFSILKGDWDGRGLDLLVTGRKAGRNEMEALSSPDWIIDDAPYFAETAPRSPGNMLTGLGVSAGKASGAAKLLCHPEEGEKLQAGDVLVAPSTDPGWTPLFLRASAIVMGAGGVLSHGAIVAREYGIPAVVNIPGVMKIINDGQLINVDGDEGKVYL